MFDSFIRNFKPLGAARWVDYMKMYNIYILYIDVFE